MDCFGKGEYHFMELMFKMLVVMRITITFGFMVLVDRHVML